MNEVATGPVRTKPGRVIGAAEFRLVFRVAGHDAQVVFAVCKLTLVAVFAHAVFLVRSTELGLVAAGHALTLLLALLNEGPAVSCVALTHDYLDGGPLGRAASGVGAWPAAGWCRCIVHQPIVGYLWAQGRERTG